MIKRSVIDNFLSKGYGLMQLPTTPAFGTAEEYSRFLAALENQKARAAR